MLTHVIQHNHSKFQSLPKPQWILQGFELLVLPNLILSRLYMYTNLNKEPLVFIKIVQLHYKQDAKEQPHSKMVNMLFHS